jgi:hypothetical protein
VNPHACRLAGRRGGGTIHHVAYMEWGFSHRIRMSRLGEIKGRSRVSIERRRSRQPFGNCPVPELPSASCIKRRFSSASLWRRPASARSSGRQGQSASTDAPAGPRHRLGKIGISTLACWHPVQCCIALSPQKSSVCTPSTSGRHARRPTSARAWPPAIIRASRLSEGHRSRWRISGEQRKGRMQFAQRSARSIR